MDNVDIYDPLDDDKPNHAQIDFAMEEVKKAGLEIIESGWNGTVYEILINTMPHRVLCICFRDEDYWVGNRPQVGNQLIWPGSGKYGFQIEGAFRKALQAFISGAQTY